MSSPSRTFHFNVWQNSLQIKKKKNVQKKEKKKLTGEAFISKVSSKISEDNMKTSFDI